jgi:2-keto-3-deoxy-L-rhamnonate aldolase RhmA
MTEGSAANFRTRLRAGERLVGTFVKTPHPVVVEVLGHAGLDCVCLDCEHAPFDRAALDTALLAARAAQLPALVRPLRAETADILNALDLGATGILAPHVASGEQARALVRAAHYGPGGRGYAGSTRAAGYGTRSVAQNVDKARGTVAVIAQIEDAEALRHLDEIAAVEGLDALFVGRMDLTVSLGATSPADPVVIEAVRQICLAGRRAGRAVGMFMSSTQEAAQWIEMGASLFLLGSDQQWILQGAKELAGALHGKG